MEKKLKTKVIYKIIIDLLVYENRFTMILHTVLMTLKFF